MARHPDVVSGSVITLLGLALGAASMYIDINPNQTTLSARFLPLLTASVLAACGVGIVIRGLRLPAMRMPFLFSRKLLVMAALLLGYFLTFPIMDFRFAAWFMMLAGMYVLGNREPKHLLIAPVGVAAAIYLIFRYAFNVVLPTWT